MKKITLIILSCFFIFSNCSVDNPSSSDTTQNVNYLWHLVNVTGGIAGEDWEFNVNTIVWDFDDETETLIVDNKNTNDSIEDSLESGTYNYYQVEIDGVFYLVVDDIELGSFEIVSSLFRINQNIMTTGERSDGFIYTFQLETVTE